MKIALSDASYFYFLLRYTLVLTEMNPVINTINNEQRLIKREVRVSESFGTKDRNGICHDENKLNNSNCSIRIRVNNLFRYGNRRYVPYFPPMADDKWMEINNEENRIWATVHSLCECTTTNDEMSSVLSLCSTEP